MTKQNINKLVKLMKEEYNRQKTTNDYDLMLINHRELDIFDIIDLVVVDKFLNHTCYVLTYYVEKRLNGNIHTMLHKFYIIDTYAIANDIVEFENLNRDYLLKDGE